MMGYRANVGRSMTLVALTIGAILLGLHLPSGKSGTAGAAASRSGLSATRPRIDLSKIQHIVIIMQENRSFDEYFGTYPGADGINPPPGTPTPCVPDPATGKCVAPYHTSSDPTTDLPHSALDASADINGGLMNGFITQYEKTCPNPACKQNGPVVMGYHDARDIPNYWTYAQQFVLQDHMFAPNYAYSLPSHLAMVSAWTAVCSQPGVAMSCTNSLNPQSIIDFNPTPTPQVRPDYAWTDITYLLHQHGVSWAYYIPNGTQPSCPGTGPICLPPPGIPQLKFGAIQYWNPLPFFDTVKQDNELGNIKFVSNFFAAAANGTLPAVSWIVPTWPTSEHPPNKPQDGQAYVTGLVNAIMSGPAWDSTAIFIAWDDWGGFYDHQAPPIVDSNGYGIRVPALMISAYAKQGYIDHQMFSFDAYLKLIEDRFLGGQRLDPATDGRPDQRPGVRENAVILGDLSNEFDFAQTPRPPLILTPYPTPSVTPPTSTPTPPARAFVNPGTGAYSQTVTITGTGFGPNEAVNVYWDDSSAPPPITAATTGSSGNFKHTFAVPLAANGAHSVIAVGKTTGLSAQTPFQVNAKVFLQAVSGPTGTHDALTGTGFAPHETVMGWWNTYHGLALGSTTTSAVGSFNAGGNITFTVPMSGLGTYPVIAVGTNSGVYAFTPFTITAPLATSSSPIDRVHRCIARSCG